MPSSESSSLRSDSSALRLLLADDHPIFVAGLRSFFDEHNEIEVVGEATSPRQAARLIAQTRPDVAVMDVMLGGTSIISEMIEEAPKLQIICLTAHEDPTLVRHAISSGARGYVLKRSVEQNIFQAIQAVSRGGVYIDPAIANRVLGIGRANVTRNGRVQKVQCLTEREREVLRLIAYGFTIKEVAGKLGVTTKSIETYKARAAEKLDIRSRAKIVEYAILQGWFHSECV